MLWGVSQPLLPCVCMKTQHSKNNLKQPGCLAGEKKSTEVFWFLLGLELCSVAYIVCVWSCVNTKDWNSLSDLGLVSSESE